MREIAALALAITVPGGDRLLLVALFERPITSGIAGSGVARTANLPLDALDEPMMIRSDQCMHQPTRNDANMTTTSDRELLATLEKRVSELATLVRYQDTKRVEIEKCIGVIDQQLIRTDAGLHQVRKFLKVSAPKKVAAKPAPPAPKSKPKAKAPAKAKAKAKKHK